jgi:hypothetical protein
MMPVSRKSERIKINIRVSVSDEIARCLGLGFGSASSLWSLCMMQFIDAALRLYLPISGKTAPQKILKNI